MFFKKRRERERALDAQIAGLSLKYTMLESRCVEYESRTVVLEEKIKKLEEAPAEELTEEQEKAMGKLLDEWMNGSEDQT